MSPVLVRYCYLLHRRPLSVQQTCVWQTHATTVTMSLSSTRHFTDFSALCNNRLRDCAILFTLHNSTNKAKVHRSSTPWLIKSQPIRCSTSLLTYHNAAEAGLSCGHRYHAENTWWRLDMQFQRQNRRQTHIHITILHYPTGGVISHLKRLAMWIILNINQAYQKWQYSTGHISVPVSSL